MDLVIYPNGKRVSEVCAEVALPTFRVENCRGGWAGIVAFKVTLVARCACFVAVDAQERQSPDALE